MYLLIDVEAARLVTQSERLRGARVNIHVASTAVIARTMIDTTWNPSVCVLASAFLFGLQTNCVTTSRGWGHMPLLYMLLKCFRCSLSATC